MAKKSKKKQKLPVKTAKQFITKHIKIIGSAIVILVIGVTALVLAWPAHKEANTDRSIFRNGEIVTVEGVYVCLPHKNTTGPQTDECALGIQTDDGHYFGLQVLSDGYTALAGLQSGDRLEAKGTYQKRDSIYQSSGVIITDSLKPLED